MTIERSLKMAVQVQSPFLAGTQSDVQQERFDDHLRRADNAFSDNRGGVSLNVTSAAPEPAVFALLLAGLGMVGTFARRR